MNLECTDGATTSAQHPLIPPSSGKPSRVGDRVKLACSGCRRDNKKVLDVLSNSVIFISGPLNRY